MAAIPEPEFEQRLARVAEDPVTMTTRKILRRLARLTAPPAVG